MVSLPRYDKYQDSGIEWLGEIPEYWAVKKIKFICKYNQITLEDNTDPNLEFFYVDIGSVTQGSINKLEYFLFKNAPSRARRKAKEGDTIISTVRTYLKAISYINENYENCVFSTGFCILSPYQKINNKFFTYLLQSENFINEVVRLSEGVSYPSITPSKLSNLQVCIPAITEQKRIVEFLDRKCGEIDEAISKKQRLIELLEEQKNILINQAVTQGISNRSNLKKTENVFFPFIEKSFSLVRLGNLCKRVVDGPHFSPNYVDQGYMFISARNIRPDKWLLEDAKFVSERDYLQFCKRVKPEKGDVLYTKGGTTGVAKVVDLDFPFQVWVHIAVLKIYPEKVLPEYLAYALNSHNCYQQSQLYTRGATNNDLGLTRMVNIYLPLPSLSQQKQIVDFLKHQISIIQEISSNLMIQIKLLEEVKQIIIAEAVTGKIKV